MQYHPADKSSHNGEYYKLCNGKTGKKRYDINGNYWTSEGSDSMLGQKCFFEGLGFEEIEMQYGYGKETCYKGPDGGFYRIDYFPGSYVIESAKNEEEARLNQFEDNDIYDDTVREEELLSMIQADLKRYTTK